LDTGRTADCIIFNATIHTQDTDAPVASALAVSGSRICAVGQDIDVVALAQPTTRLIDAKGASVLPGFNESHAHLFAGASELANLDLFGTRGIDDLGSRLRTYEDTFPGDGLIVGNHLDYTVLGDERRLTRHDLDAVSPTRPVLLFAPDHHTAWANTIALKQAGLLDGKTLAPGNEIVMDASGTASGELRESLAFTPVLDLSPRLTRARLGLATGGEPDPYPDVTEIEHDLGVLRLGLRHAARHGITSIQNMDGNLYTLELLAELERRQELTVRVRVPFHFKPNMPLAALDRASMMARRFTGQMLTSGTVKCFMDGVLDSWTAVMADDYADRARWRGEPLFSQDAFDAMAIEADRRGLQIAVHAIGDGAVSMVLNGYAAAQAANGRRDARHRIEHIEVVQPSDIARFKGLGVIAAMQPPHPPGSQGLPLEPTLSRIGRSKLPYAYAWKSISDAGVPVVFGTDWPVSDINPLRSIHSALTREPWAAGLPDQRPTLNEAIERYTVAGAHAEFAEHEKGIIRTGMLADIVMLDRNLNEIKRTEIDLAKVTMTICGGTVTYAVQGTAAYRHN
jgi:predicted amidohydrolase YtcJ